MILLLATLNTWNITDLKSTELTTVVIFQTKLKSHLNKKIPINLWFRRTYPTAWASTINNGKFSSLRTPEGRLGLVVAKAMADTNVRKYKKQFLKEKKMSAGRLRRWDVCPDFQSWMMSVFWTHGVKAGEWNQETGRRENKKKACGGITTLPC